MTLFKWDFFYQTFHIGSCFPSQQDDHDFDFDDYFGGYASTKCCCEYVV